MISCPSCNAEQTETSVFCSACGAALNPELAATIMHEAAASSADSSVHSSPSDSSHHGRFLPGTKVADRYRIVSLVGKGGMGEVYRADDLKLGHTVALKFLPKDLADDPQRLEYFHSEVRLTRQISHPNVCRVYDIGEVDGQHFLSMEYIDGEDLKILLRRIGRLPNDKGVQIAQQLCAGLAAAHERGVLHRDLKPANIMVDGRGQVRITDFGLAKLADDGGEGEIAGTPAYMAPEQLSRGEATIQSDLYSLGLILYELFTGKAVHKPGSIPDLMRAHEESSISQPTSLVSDIEPAVDRVILRCLEKEPHDRPQSANAVSAALPGGDPLAAALAAGETPSPEMVAAAGGSGTMSRPVASICLAIVLVGLACYVLVAGHFSPTRNMRKVAQTLVDDAHNTLTALQLADPGKPPVDEAYGFSHPKEGEPKDLEFWLRQSPKPLTPNVVKWSSRRTVTLTNPGAVVPGMISLRLNHDGLLRELHVVPKSIATNNNPVVEDPDSERDRPLFELSGLVVNEKEAITDNFRITKSVTWRPPDFANEVYSWIPKNGEQTDVARIDVAKLNERVVYFRVRKSPKEWPTFWGFAPLSFVAIIMSMFLAWRNLRAGRSDRKAAWRLGVFIFTVNLASSLLSAHHSIRYMDHEMTLILSAISRSTFNALRMAVYYLALEPLARRYWPKMLTAWSRAVAGRFQNPIIGREILIGAAAFVIFKTLAGTFDAYPQPETVPDNLLGLRFLLAHLLSKAGAGIGFVIYIAIIMVLLRIVLRNEWLALLGTVAVFTLVMFNSESVAWAGILIVFFGMVALFIARLGVIAAGSCVFCNAILSGFPMDNNLVGPDVAGCVFAVMVIIAWAGYGFYTSVGGRSRFAEMKLT
jgi:serine/threonine-protein kinase